MLEGIADIAREHSLLLLADEIYDRILFDDAEHIPMATVAPDLLCLTFNGLSKTYRVAGYRSGWLVITGPKEHAAGFLEGINCSPPPGCARTCPRSTPCRRRCPACSRSTRSSHRPVASTSSGMPRGRGSRRSRA